MTFPAGPLRRVVREGCLDHGAALVARRPEDLLQERIDEAISVVIGIDHDEVDGPDEATGAHGWPESENRSTDNLASGFSHEDARLREVDQLSEQVA